MQRFEKWEVLDYTKEPIREKGGYSLYLATCGEDSELHAITEDGYSPYTEFEFHDSISLVAQKWNELTGDDVEGFDLAWEPNYTAFGHLGRLAESIEAQHVQKACNHDGPCEHIMAFFQYLSSHEDDRELFEDYFLYEFPCNMFSRLANIEDNPENWVSEEHLSEWLSDYAPENN